MNGFVLRGQDVICFTWWVPLRTSLLDKTKRIEEEEDDESGEVEDGIDEGYSE